MTQCAAKSKRTGERCQQQAMTGSKVCYHHGGNTPKGVASPHFKTGRYSAHMPARLLDRYNEAANDPALLELSQEIALLDARLADLLTRVDSGESKTLWSKARNTCDKLLRAFESNDLGGLHVGILELDRTIGSGLLDHEAWYEIHSVIDQRRKLAESERKRIVEAEQMVKADKALTLATALLSAIKENVTDRNTLSAIQMSFTKLLNAETVDV